MECPVIGHERCRAALEAELPAQPVLLLGPASTGKWLLAKYLGAHHVPWYNQWEHATPGVGDIRELRKFLTTPPKPGPPRESLPVGQIKVVLVNLDGAKSTAVQHALLKELEEPPSYARFLLVSSKSPLPTVSSRCLIWRLGRLTTEQVARVLVYPLGFSPRDAAALAPIGGGTIFPATAAALRFRPARQAVLNVLKAVSTRDKELLERAVKDWGDTEDWMLRELLGAAASGRPTPVFSQVERMIIGRTAARRGMALLTASGRARPQVAVRAMAGALMEAR